MDFEAGQVVVSKRGRDKGLALAVLQADGEWLWLADGRTRKVDKPKRKKTMHVQPTNHVAPVLKDRITNGPPLTDADVRKVLAEYATGG